MTKDLDNIFSRLKSLLQTYSPPLTATTTGAKTDKDQYSLISKKEVVIAGRKKPVLWFAGIIKQKSYVGFYFNPVYANPKMKKLLHPDLLKLLKGKSCFYVKQYDDNLEKQIIKALKLGLTEFKKNGWI